MSRQIHVSTAGYVVVTMKASDGRVLRICGEQAPRGPVRDEAMRSAALECLRTERFERMQDAPRVRVGRRRAA
jgi:hypothetical protein